MEGLRRSALFVFAHFSGIMGGDDFHQIGCPRLRNPPTRFTVLCFDAAHHVKII